MRVWKRVRSYAKTEFTAIIHGKADHEETRATASRATTDAGGHYLVILTIEDCEYVCNYIMGGGDRKGCQIVDTTCGDVMRVWKRVRSYAKTEFTAIIHGKADHEETRATASRATTDAGGHYLVILTIEDCEYVCNYIMGGGDRKGCQIVDTTCGDVMRVWKRVRSYAKTEFTAIIHGKADHEETRATASRATTDAGGHYLVILTIEDCEYVCNYIMGSGVKKDFLQKFSNAHSSGFDPDEHLKKIGVANQTTMLKGETEEIQKKLYKAIQDRDGEKAAESFQFFDTICGATQERQDALYEMLKLEMDILLVVGGYNSSNTTHLVEIGQNKIPSFFIRDAKCLESFEQILHFDLENKIEKRTYSGNYFNASSPITIGITAGASCPNNLIEETILRIFQSECNSLISCPLI
jgi:(E)-4-hydroxy-3-methyl-but-2-enyl pyrophosphate reductase